MNTLYRILSALLSYPSDALLEALPEIDRALAGTPQARATLAPLTGYLAGNDLIALQENYVATFDRSPGRSLHLFEHIHGESRDRGPAMLDLLREYQQRGFEPDANELPDYLPLFLEFLGQLEPDHGKPLLDDAIHVIAALGQRLERDASPYAAVCTVLCSLTEVQPLPLVEPPVHDMDEMLETFGPGADGVEPLLKPHVGAVQPLHFHPRASA